jgi:hypothetical protein
MSGRSDQSAVLPPLWPFLIVCALAAVLVVLGTFHQCQHADSLIYVPISLYRWTPFYWELDRVGMLVPLLAKPFTDLLTNLLVQCGLDVFFGLAAFFLLARYMVRNATYPLVGTLGAALFLMLTPPYYRFEFFLATYGIWLTLGLGGLVLLEPGPDGLVPGKRRFLALLLLVLAHWIYCTASLFLGPLIVFRFLAFRSQQPRAAPAMPPPARSRVARLWGTVGLETGLSLVLLATAFAIGFVFMKCGHHHQTQFGSLPLVQWPGAWQQLLYRTWVNLAPQRWPMVLALAAGLGLLLLLAPAVRALAGQTLRPALALALAAIAIGLFMGTRKHVQANLYMFRFLSPSAFFLQASCLVLAVVPLAAVLASHRLRRLSLLASPLLVVAAVVSYGLPSLEGVRADVSQNRIPTITGIAPLDGIRTEDILDARCTHVVGDYWKVWPAVYNANRILHDRGERTIVWGVSMRSQPTQCFWSKVPVETMRVAVPVGDPQAEEYLRRYGFPPLEIAEKRDTVWILRPRTVARATALPQG